MFYSYILTPDEEAECIRYQIEREMRWAARRMFELGYLPNQIELKLREIDFKAKLDEFELLDKANVRKHWQIESKKMDAELKEQQRLQMNETANQCNAGYFFRLLSRSFKNEDKPFIQDEFSNPYIKALCFFMSNDPRFETELGYSHKKGLWVKGLPGLGKTRLINGIAENELAPVKMISMLSIAENVQKYGEYELSFGDYRKVLCDDVGSEQAVVNHFGTKINWFKDFIELSYAKGFDFSKVLVTTNCDFNEIEERYGYRVRSRIREKFNIITVEGTDRR